MNNKLINKLKNDRPLLHSVMTFISYTKPNYDYFIEKFEKENIGKDILDIDDNTLRVLVDEYYGIKKKKKDK